MAERKRRISSITAKVEKHKKAKHHLTAAEKLEARKAYANYIKHRSSKDAKVDALRARFRAKKRGGRSLAPGKAHPLTTKARGLHRKAIGIVKKAQKEGREVSPEEKKAVAGLRSKVKNIYSNNRKRIALSAKKHAHAIMGHAILKVKALAKKHAKSSPEMQAKITGHIHKILGHARNQAVRHIKDTRASLTAMRKMSGRNHGVKRTKPKGFKVGKKSKAEAKPAEAKPAAKPKHNPIPGGAPHAAHVIPEASKTHQTGNAKSKTASAKPKGNRKQGGKIVPRASAAKAKPHRSKEAIDHKIASGAAASF